MLHKLNDEQVELLKNLLACFVKPEFLNNSSGDVLSKLDLSNDKNLLSSKDMFVGHKVKKIIRDCHKADSLVLDFLKLARIAYVACGKHLQKKMPVTNKFMKHLSALDPIVKGTTVCLTHMKNLPSIGNKCSD